MKKTVQEEVAEEVIEELKQNSDIVGIEIFGSIARNEIKETSDVDIQVTSKSAIKTELVCGKKKGIDYHYFVMPFVAVKRMKEMYLFLFCPEPSIIVYDPTGILAELYQRANNYYEAHPEALEFWNEKMQQYREAKKLGKPTEDFSKILDQVELRFSQSLAITRTWHLTEN